jgi:polysaccharide export outer membrane protein
MLSPSAGTSLSLQYSKMCGTWIGCCALLCVLLMAPAAWSQTSAQNAGQASPLAPSDPQKPQSAEAANDRITQLAVVQAGKGDYLLSSGDLVGVEVFDVPELTRDVRVSDSGYISIPLLPTKVRASGLTALQLQEKLAELLLANGLVSHPQVTITVKEQHGEPITVIGAVKSPMVVQALHPMTLLEVLSRAGGIADDAGGEILITRGAHPANSAIPAADETAETEVPPQATPASESAAEPKADAAAQLSPDPSPSPDTLLSEQLTLRVSLNDLLETGDPKYNVMLNGGDVVSVPRAGVVYAVGGVQHPGGFVMASDHQQLTVLKLLSLSGGLMPVAKARDAVIIRQSPDSQQQQVPVNLEQILARKAKDPVLQQSDILFVPISGSKQTMGRVAQAAMALATGVAIVRLGN